MLKPFVYFLLGISLVSIPCFSYAADYLTAEELNQDMYDSCVTSTYESAYVANNPCDNWDNPYKVSYDAYGVITQITFCEPANSTYSRVVTTYYSTSCVAALPPEEPAHCSNGSMDEDEVGINCGGSCSASCVSTCPDNYTLDAFGSGQCYSDIQDLADDLGNCPSGYRPSTQGDGSTMCVQLPEVIAPVLSSAENTGLAIEEANNNNPAPDTFEGGTFSLTENFVSSTVDNGDGTSTTTTSTVTNSSDGSSSTTTTSTTTDNSTGDVVGSSSTTTGNGTEEDNPENYDYPTADVGDFSDMGIVEGYDTSDPDQDVVAQLFDDQIENSSLVARIKSIGITTSSPVCSLSGSVFGKPVEFSMCGDLFVDTFDYMGYVLVFCSIITACFIIIGRG